MPIYCVDCGIKAKKTHSDFSLKGRTLICLRGATSFAASLLTIVTKPQSDKRVAIVLRL